MSVVTREDWGAKPPILARLDALVKVETQVVHHSAIQSVGLTPDEEKKAVRAIQKLHMLDRGYADIAYHYLVAPSGRVYEGRHPRYQGAGVYGHNENTVHVCLLGNYENEQPSREAIKGVVDALKMLPGKHKPLVGHGDFGGSECPGSHLHARLPDIRERRDRK